MEAKDRKGLSGQMEELRQQIDSLPEGGTVVTLRWKKGAREA